MIQNLEMALGLSSLRQWMAQVPVDETINTPERAALVFSGPRFFVALVSGLVLAFAFQLLLTNLSVAAGISYLGRSSDSDSDDSHESSSLGGTIKKIGFAVGLWTLITVTVALFIACLLAVKLSITSNPALGAIVGLVIWGAYFTLLVWVSSTTVGSLIGSVVNTATSGFQAIVGTATAALGAKAVNDQVVSTAEAAAAAVRRELGSGLDPTSIRESIEDYLDALRPPELDMSRIRGEFEKLLNDPELRAIAGEGSTVEMLDRLRHVDRNTFVNLISNRTDLSKRDAQRLVDQLDSIWRQVVNQFQRRDPTAELVAYLKSVQPNTVDSAEFRAKLDQLTEEVRRQGELQRSQLVQAAPGRQEQPGLINQALNYGFTTLIGTVMGRTDLSDLDVEKILAQLQGLKDKTVDKTKQVAGQVAEKTPGLPFNTIRADVENYLLNAYSWHFNRVTLETEFRDVIYDPEADPGTVRRQLEQVDRSFFVDLLNQRGDLTQARMTEIADQLETIRSAILSQVSVADEQEQSKDLRSRVEHYLRNTQKEELNPEGIQRDFSLLLNDPNAGYDALKQRLSQFDRNTLVALLSQRQDMTPEEADQVIAQLESTRDSILQAPQAAIEKVKDQYDQTTAAITDYLRRTNLQELDPDGIRRDLNTLLQDPKAGTYALRARLAQMDRETLVKLLSQRGDLTEEQVNRTIDQLQATIRTLVRAPRRVAARTQTQVRDFQTTLESYLRNTNKEELNPEGIKRDLQLLFSDPRAGVGNLSDRLSHVDRATIVALLSQRQDMTEEEANRIVDQVLSVRDQFVAQIQKIQNRIQAVIDSILARIRDYLNSLDRPELNYDSIKRDVRTLFYDPKAGFEALRDRLGSFNRDTLVALISSREDISESAAHRIIDQVESARMSVLRRAERIQEEAQRRVEEVKYQAHKQMRETRKAAETASWWLFGTALVSGAASAIAGALAVSGG